MHTSPEDVALLALGEAIGTPEQHAHLAQCRVCSAELDEMRRVVVVARQSDPDDGLSQPSPAVWRNIQAEIAALPPSATAGTPAPARRSSAPRRRLALTLAAVVLLIAGVAGGFAAGRLSQPAKVTAPSVHLNAMPTWPGAEGHAEVAKDAQGNPVLVVQVNVPEQTKGRMEVWLSDDRSLNMQAMGYLDNGAGTFSLAGHDLSQTPVLDVSMEPPNDPHPDAHSGVSVVRGRLVR